MNLHVHQFGDGGRTFVGFHGWAGSYRTFDPLAAHLPEDATLFAFDLPGYGETPAPGDWSVEGYGRLLSDAVASLDRGPVTLVGNCSGAIFGLLVGKTRPELVDEFVLIDPFAYVPWYFGVFLVPLLGPLAYWSTFANPLGRWISNSALAKRRTDETDLTGSFLDLDHRATWRTLRVLGDIGDYRYFEGMSARVHMLYGENTFGAVKRSVGLWQKLWPDATAESVLGAGHLPIQEGTLQVARAVFAPSAERAHRESG